jgi:hypothetical protein
MALMGQVVKTVFTQARGYSMSSRTALAPLKLLSRAFSSTNHRLGDVFTANPRLLEMVSNMQLKGTLSFDAGLQGYLRLLNRTHLTTHDLVHFDYWVFDYLRMVLNNNFFGVCAAEEAREAKLGFGAAAYAQQHIPQPLVSPQLRVAYRWRQQRDDGYSETLVAAAR